MYRPTRTLSKTYAGGLAASASIIVIWLLNRYLNADVPTEVATAITSLFTIGAFWLMPLLPGEIEEIPTQPRVRQPDVE